MEQSGKINIFWGAGKTGRKALSFCQGCGLQPDYFYDNNLKLAGSKINGVEVISLEKLKELSPNAFVYITCRDEKTVRGKLTELGIEEKRAIRFNTVASMLETISHQPGVELPVKQSAHTVESDLPEILFDLSNGLVMGGVESWSIQTAHMLEEMGHTTALLANNPSVTEESGLKVGPICLQGNLTEWDKLGNLVKLFVGANRTILVCSFMGYYFAAACLAKKNFPEKVKVVVVVHSDVEVFYDDCAQMEQYIDECLVISEEMKAKLADRNFPGEKISFLPWEIACDEGFDHTYSVGTEPLHIGYAGRIVIAAKRVDLLLLVADKLRQMGVEFVLELAGTGIFEEEFLQEITKRGLQERVHLLGRLDHAQIRAFWKRQDIMISCSEHEGHSISQCEAMAAGAVPVLTDTSGVKDDVTDGKNGFIVKVGAVDQIVDKICFLYYHRELLPVLGKEAYQTIKQHNSREQIQKIWTRILK